MLTKVLNRVAQVIKDQVTPIQTYFGHGTHIILLQQLQAECDTILADLLRRFIADRSLVSMTATIKAQRDAQRRTARQPQSSPTNAVAPLPDSLDPPKLDALLEEICISHTHHSLC
jgi:hypothetical protein